MEKDATMLVTVEAKVLWRRDGLVMLKVRTLYGDPVIAIAEDAIRAEAFRC
jgi:hypothetical protein